MNKAVVWLTLGVLGSACTLSSGIDLPADGDGIDQDVGNVGSGGASTGTGGSACVGGSSEARAGNSCGPGGGAGYGGAGGNDR